MPIDLGDELAAIRKKEIESRSAGKQRLRLFISPDFKNRMKEAFERYANFPVNGEAEIHESIAGLPFSVNPLIEGWVLYEVDETGMPVEMIAVAT